MHLIPPYLCNQLLLLIVQIDIQVIDILLPHFHCLILFTPVVKEVSFLVLLVSVQSFWLEWIRLACVLLVCLAFALTVETAIVHVGEGLLHLVLDPLLLRLVVGGYLQVFLELVAES